MQPAAIHEKPEILLALASVEEEVAAFFGTLGYDEFALRSGDSWTPAEHLKHLNTSVSAVARGFSMPRLALRIRFGRPRATSRTLAQVREGYRARLEEGGRSTAEFEPERDDFLPEEIRGARNKILARWTRVNARLRAAVERWDERQLDKVLLPHPLLGKLTAREMLFFTLYHNQHHVQAAKRRLPRFAAEFS